MRIRIDFADARDHISLHDKFLNDCGEELKEYIIENYFNGADLAVIFIGYSLDNEYFEFDLIQG